MAKQYEARLFNQHTFFTAIMIFSRKGIVSFAVVPSTSQWSNAVIVSVTVTLFLLQVKFNNQSVVLCSFLWIGPLSQRSTIDSLKDKCQIFYVGLKWSSIFWWTQWCQYFAISGEICYSSWLITNVINTLILIISILIPNLAVAKINSLAIIT